ncbi:MAG: FAD:protein FMN transferase [Burkholderiales bacterium]
MQRRTFISGSLGVGAMASVTGLSGWADPIAQAMPSAANLHTGSATAFGTTVTIKVLHDNPPVARAAIEDALAQVQTIDALMSLKQERSQVFQLNQHGALQAPDTHLLAVLTFAQQLSMMTAGSFDITVQPLWNAFSQASANASLPKPAEIAAAKALVGWQRLEFDRQQVHLKTPGMAITLNGLAQGYAVDLALQALRNRGVQHALLDTGEYGSIGNKAQGQSWLLGVGDPRHDDVVAATLKMDGRKVATSGDYATYFSADFVHHHIFDPASGDSPLELASATVVAPTGILADGLSTAFMVLGVEKSLALATKIHDVDAMLIDKSGTVRTTSGFPLA